jgi:hypothetical protein
MIDGSYITFLKTRFTEEVVLSVSKDHQPSHAETERNYSKRQVRQSRAGI